MKDLSLESLKSLTEILINAGSTVLYVVALFLLGWLVARFVYYVIHKLLTIAKFDALSERINAQEMLQKANVSASPSAIVARFVYYIVLLLFIILITDSLGLSVISELLSEFINFVPNLIAAILIFILGVFVAGIIRDVIAATTASLGVGPGKFISAFVYYFLVIMVSLSALKQINVDTSLISNNIEYFVMAVLLASSISYGFASYPFMRNMLASYFGKRTFEVGQKIQVDDVVGTIVQINSVSVVIQTDVDFVVIPSMELMNKNVHIIALKQPE